MLLFLVGFFLALLCLREGDVDALEDARVLATAELAREQRRTLVVEGVLLALDLASGAHKLEPTRKVHVLAGLDRLCSLCSYLIDIV